MSNDPKRVSCPVCGTTTTTDSMEDAVETAERHDEMQHGGERTATVNGILPPSDKVAEAAKEALEYIRSADPDGEPSGEADR